MDSHKRTIRIESITEIGREEYVRLKAIVRPKLIEAIELFQALASDLNGYSDLNSDNIGDDPKLDHQSRAYDIGYGPGGKGFSEGGRQVMRTKLQVFIKLLQEIYDFLVHLIC